MGLMGKFVREINCFYFSFRTGRWNRPTLLNRCVLRSSTFGKYAIGICFWPRRGWTDASIAPFWSVIEGDVSPQVPLRGTQRLSEVRPLPGLSLICRAKYKLNSSVASRHFLYKQRRSTIKHWWRGEGGIRFISYGEMFLLLLYSIPYKRLTIIWLQIKKRII